MYQIKRGDEVVFKSNNVADIFISLLGLIHENGKRSVEPLDHYHLGLIDLIYAYDGHSGPRIFDGEEILENNLTLIAAKYGLTIEEVKDV